MTAHEVVQMNTSGFEDNVTLGFAFEESVILQTLNSNEAALLTPAIVYTLVLMIIGVVGNPIAMFIYGFRWPQSTTKYFLCSISILDFINCVITMPTEVALMMHFYHFTNSAICKISRFTTYTMNNACVFVLLIISIDRFLMICKPYSQPISILGSKITCVVAVVVGFGVSWPALVIYGNDYVAIPISKTLIVQGVVCLVETQYKNTVYSLAFFLYLCVAFSSIAIVMTVLYICIGREIMKRKHMKRLRTSLTSQQVKDIRHGKTSEASYDAVPCSEHHSTEQRGSLNIKKHDTASQKASNGSTNSAPSVFKGRFSSLNLSKRRFRPGKSTLMLFSITMVYILSFLPFLTIGITRIVLGDSFYRKLSPTGRVIVNIFLRSYLVNNCANPIVYGLCNSQFRKHFVNMFKCKSYPYSP